MWGARCSRDTAVSPRLLYQVLDRILLAKLNRPVEGIPPRGPHKVGVGIRLDHNLLGLANIPGRDGGHELAVNVQLQDCKVRGSAS